jgi:hypothetical protein
MATESLTNVPVVDCQELSSLITCAMDYGYQFGLANLLAIENPIDADPYFEQTVEAIFDGRDIFFTDVENGKRFRLSKDSLLKAAMNMPRCTPKSILRSAVLTATFPKLA